MLLLCGYCKCLFWDYFLRTVNSLPVERIWKSEKLHDMHAKDLENSRNYNREVFSYQKLIQRYAMASHIFSTDRQIYIT